MKKLSKNLSVLAMLLFSIFYYHTALPQALICYWNFNDNSPGSDQNWEQPIAAKFGSAEITYSFTEAFSFAGTGINGTGGEVNGGSFAPRGGINNINNGAFLTLNAPTNGYHNIALSYPTRRTSTGFTTHEIQYTIDGNTWLTKETIDISQFQNNWLANQTINIDFSNISQVNNNPDFAIRIVLTGASSATGNNRFDNIRISGMICSLLTPPTAFNATALLPAQNNLSWHLNQNNNPVLIAWSVNGVFGIPAGNYQPGDAISGGGIVLYSGSHNNLEHTNLNPVTNYYYRAWSFHAGEYSTGVTAQATTLPEPEFTDLPYMETFDNNLGENYVYSVSGDTKYWIHGTWSGNGYAMMNGFNSGEIEEDWLILPGINLNSYENIVLTFETAWNFGIEDENNYLKLFYSTDYAGSGNPSAGYYSNACGLAGQELQLALHQIIRNHTTRTYSQLFNDFFSTDRKPNNKVWDMYSDVPAPGSPPFEFTFFVDQCSTVGLPEGSCYNREHTFPSSWSGGGTSPQDTVYTDLFHIHPADSWVNWHRSNHPYGVVNDAPTTMNGGKLGPNAFSYSGVFTGTVFEPIDAYKGDLARNYFYILTRYKHKIAEWSDNSPMLEGDCLAPWAVAMLLQWHEQDPVSQKEIDRNNAVFDLQGNRNPFIDHPEFVNLIWDSNPKQSHYKTNNNSLTAKKIQVKSTWTELEFNKPPSGNYVWAPSGQVNLTEIVGSSVFIAFKYRYEPGFYRRWQVDNISLTGDQITVFPGDANCDGLVNVSDIVTIINFVLGQNPQPFCFENADINGDEIINVSDVVGTVNIILGNL